MKMPELKTKPKAWLAPVLSTIGESRGVQILSGLLVLQLIAAAGLLWRSNSEGDFSSATQLIAFDSSAVTEIVIAEQEDSVTLTRTDDQWQMDDEYQTLAAADKIDEVLSTLSDLKPGLPVANTAGSHAQLEVADDAYQRRLTVKAGDDTVADLYLGTSPGFRKSHARQIDQNEVYAVRLNTFDVPADHDDWLDGNLLRFSDVTSIEADGIKLARADDQWSIEAPSDRAESHEVGTTEIESVLSQLSSLRVTGFTEALQAEEPVKQTESDSANTATSTAASAGSDDSTEAGEAEEAPEPLLVHELKIAQGGEPVTLTIGRKGGDATVTRSDVQGVFALPIASFDALTPEALQSVIVEKSADEPGSEPTEDTDGSSETPSG